MIRLENLLLRYFHYLDAKGRTYNIVVGILWMLGICIADLSTPADLNFSYFYLMPISFVAWFSGFYYGSFIAVISAIFWAFHHAADAGYVVSFANTFFSALFFISVAALLRKTRDMWENEKELSRLDPLTGAKNLRAFTELVNYGLLQAQRHKSPFSLAYLDLDNFKFVNDNFGHNAGDELLQTIATLITENLRKTDVVGRLGGDEFAIFLPETDQEAVRIVMEKVSSELRRMMEKTLWPTTFSMGVVTCWEGRYDFDVLLKHADTLMYEVKHTGKNNISYAVCPSLATKE